MMLGISDLKLVFIHLKKLEMLAKVMFVHRHKTTTCILVKI